MMAECLFWSVRAGNRHWFSFCVIVLFMVGIALCFGKLICDYTRGNYYGIVETLGTIGVFSVTMTFVLFVEGGTVVTLAADYVLKKREKKGEEKGRAEANKEVLDMIESGKDLDTIRTELEGKNGVEN